MLKLIIYVIIISHAKSLYIQWRQKWCEPSDWTEALLRRTEQKPKVVSAIDSNSARRSCAGMFNCIVNISFSSSLANLTRKMDSLTSENILLQEEVTTTKLSLVQLQKENVLLQNENLTLCEVHKKQIIVSFLWKLHDVCVINDHNQIPWRMLQ